MVAPRRVVVIGGSAGAIEVLMTLVSELPPDLPAAVCVVVHVPSGGVSRLPQILQRAGRLPAAHARDGEQIAPGRIYVAPPDRHLLVRHGHVELSRGPRENHSRPAIDPLFRTAARAYGRRTIGVILSGALYDGTAGLLALTARGGAAIVQDPEEATIPSMPANALAMVRGARVLPATKIANEIARLVAEPVWLEEDRAVADQDEQIAQTINRDFSEQAADGRDGELTVYTCPDCGGVMWQSDTGPEGWFRCHVGHAYAPEVLLIQKSEEIEGALWACVRLLREKATLTRQTAARSRSGGNREMAQRIEEQAQLDEEHARIIRRLLETGPTPTEQSSDVLAEVEQDAAG